MKKTLVRCQQINLNTVQEVSPIPVGDVQWAIVDMVFSGSPSTWVGELVYRISHETPWRSFSTPVAMTAASPTSGLIGTTAIMFLGVKTTTVQGSASEASVFAFGDDTHSQTPRIGG